MLTPKKSFFRGLLVASALGAAIWAAPAAASVKIYDLGSVPFGDLGFNGFTGAGSFTDYLKFSILSSPADASASESDSVSKASFASRLITGGTFSLFSCATNCTGTLLAPTGSLIGSAAILNTGTTTQGASLGPYLLTMAGPYFLQLSGSTTAPAPNGLAFAGTLSISSAVPEPSTWAMILAGFAGLGLVARRKAQSLKAAAVA